MINSDSHYPSTLCHGIMYLLHRLDIGHNRVLRHWMGVELHILLSQGKQALEEYRREEANGWG